MYRKKRSSHLLPLLFLLALLVSAGGRPFWEKEKTSEAPKRVSEVRKVALAQPHVAIQAQTCAGLTAKHREARDRIFQSVELCDEALFLSACPALNENAAACARLGCGQDCSFSYNECSRATFQSALYGGEEEPGYTEKCLKRLAVN